MAHPKLGESVLVDFGGVRAREAARAPSAN